MADRATSVYPKLEEISYEKKKSILNDELFDQQGARDDTKNDDKKITGANPEDTVKVDMKFSILGRFFNKVNELRGKKKTE